MLIFHAGGLQIHLSVRIAEELLELPIGIKKHYIC